MRFSIVVFTFLFFSNSILAEELPDFAQDYLNRLPGKVLSLDVVLALAVTGSDSFRRIQAGAISTESAYLQASAPLAWRLEAEGQSVDDESAVNGFGPERTQRNNYRLGVGKSFSTGSDLQMEVLNVDTDLRFPSSLSSSFAAFIGNTSFSEPRATLSLSQRLWKDAFGRSTRSNLKAAEESRQAVTSTVIENMGAWAVGLAKMYYQGWLAQQQVIADKDNLKRQRRLLRIVNLQKRRGTSDAADVLQVQSSVKLAEQSLAQSSQAVNEIYKSLVLTVGLPAKFLEIDGNLVPTSLDDPISGALGFCKLSWQKVSQANPAIEKLNHELSINQSQLSAARGNMAPDVRLLFAASSNGVQPDFDQAFEDVSQWRNPRYTVGVTVSVPIEMRQEKAEYLNKLSAKTSKEYELGQAKSDLQAEWLSSCEDLSRLRAKVTEFKTMMNLQKKRVTMEERRFKIGKINAFNVIQAGNDATQAEMSFKSAQIEIRNLAWRIQEMSGGLAKTIQGMSQQ